MIINKTDFFQIQEHILNIPFSQTKAWLDSNFINQDGICYFVDSTDNPQICCFGNNMKQIGIGNRLDINGISYRPDISSDYIREFFLDIRKEEFNVITISDIDKYNSEFEVGIRRAGFIRPLGLELCPMTMIVNLDAEFSFHRNWKRNVKKSMSSNNKFKHVENPSIEDAKCFVDLFKTMQNRKNLGYMITVENIYNLFQGPFYIFFIEDENGKRISGRIEYRCGDLIYDIYAANTPEGIKSGAAYHIQQGIFEYYKTQGAKLFDYGRIPPSDNEMDQIFTAKKYSGGYPIGYNGQWVYSKSKLYLYLLSFNSFIRYKQHIY